MSSLLGGESSSTSTTVTNFPDWITPEMKAFYKQMMPSVAGLMDQPYEAYQGPRIADFSQDEVNSFDLIRQLQGQAGQGINTAMGINAEVANRGLNGFSQATIDQYMNPYMTNVMDISRGRQLDEFTRQKNSLQQQQGAIGSFGGSRAAVAQSNLYDNFSRNLAENETNMLYQGYNDSMNRAFQGTQLAGQSAMDLANQSTMYQSAGIKDAAALSTQGAQQRGLSQADLDLNYQDWATEKQYPYQQLQWGAGMVNPMASILKGQTTTTTQDSGGSGILGAALGVGSMMMGMPGIGASMMGGLGSMGAGIGSSIGLGGFSSAFNPAVSSGIFNAMSGMGIGPSGGYGWNGYAEGGQVGGDGKFLAAVLNSQRSDAEKRAGMLSRKDWKAANPDAKGGYGDYRKNYSAPFDPALMAKYMPQQVGLGTTSNFAPGGNWGTQRTPMMNPQMMPQQGGIAGMLPRFFAEGGAVSGDMYYGDYPFTGRQINPLGTDYSGGEIDPQALAMLLASSGEGLSSGPDAPVYSQVTPRQPQIDPTALAMLQNADNSQYRKTMDGINNSVDEWLNTMDEDINQAIGTPMPQKKQGLMDYLNNSTFGKAGDELSALAQRFGYKDAMDMTTDPKATLALMTMMATAGQAAPVIAGAVPSTGSLAGLLGGAGRLAAGNPMAMLAATNAATFGPGIYDAFKDNPQPRKKDAAKAEDRLPPQPTPADPNDPLAAWQNAAGPRIAGNPAAFGPGMSLPINGQPPVNNLGEYDVTSQVLGQPNYSPQSTKTADSMLGAINPSFTSTARNKNEPNTPLIAFGAALLGSKHGFFKALGEAGNAYAVTSENKEDRIRKLAQQAIENQMAQRRLQAYEMQNEIAMQSMPYKIEAMQARNQYLKSKASANPGQKDLVNLAGRLIQSGNPRYLKNPESAMEDARQMLGQDGAAESIALDESDPLGLR